MVEPEKFVGLNIVGSMFMEQQTSPTYSGRGMQYRTEGVQWGQRSRARAVKRPVKIEIL